MLIVAVGRCGGSGNDLVGRCSSMVRLSRWPAVNGGEPYSSRTTRGVRTTVARVVGGSLTQF
jgi:hypothetical protein